MAKKTEHRQLLNGGEEARGVDSEQPLHLSVLSWTSEPCPLSVDCDLQQPINLRRARRSEAPRDGINLPSPRACRVIVFGAWVKCCQGRRRKLVRDKLACVHLPINRARPRCSVVLVRATWDDDDLRGCELKSSDVSETHPSGIQAKPSLALVYVKPDSAPLPGGDCGLQRLSA